jgi:mRNA interferase HigB
VRIIALKTLKEFWVAHPDAEQPLKAWHEKVCKASWGSRVDIENEFGNQVKIIKGDRARFKIKGNTYRLVVAIDYKRGWVFIKFIGTHAEYDKIDVENH